MTKIAICGACGKMGRFIYDVISERDDCTVSAGIDKFGEAYADFPVVKEPADLPEKPDVIIQADKFLSLRIDKAIIIK